ncbi:hypothetical protein LA59_10795 [Vibrio harveyi]|nr:hypothetical protein LA59_10795 [Vibrio harveyi]
MYSTFENNYLKNSHLLTAIDELLSEEFVEMVKDHLEGYYFPDGYEVVNDFYQGCASNLSEKTYQIIVGALFTHYGYQVEFEKQISPNSRVDIFVPELKLFIEVKVGLNWEVDDVVGQVNRYKSVLGDEFNILGTHPIGHYDLYTLSDLEEQIRIELGKSTLKKKSSNTKSKEIATKELADKLIELEEQLEKLVPNQEELLSELKEEQRFQLKFNLREKDYKLRVEKAYYKNLEDKRKPIIEQINLVKEKLARLES